MRKVQKTQIEETLALMKKAHEEIRKQLSDQNREVVMQLLSDCQEGAIQAGNLIEYTEGADAPSIQDIEKYCEICYQLYEEAASEKAQNPSGVYRLLQKMIAAVENSVRQTIPIRLEIAFFCYKASMSDSLESIYFAAKADPSCDAYFVPIPYYDRNPDGSLGQMHYEGAECYPDTYELVDWKEYNVETRRPDIIYIINPYDDRNLVTSVHPGFYARRLKKLTDCLVYVPYFVHMETPDVRTLVTPGVRCSNLTIVQSENIRRYYIDRLLQESSAEEVTLRTAEEKIIALGSPKMDKIVNTGKEDYPLLEEWKTFMESADSDRKIILYNLSIFGALNVTDEGGESYLKKLRSALQFFRNRNDVTLWLRPHPLLGQSLYSMRPQLFEEYEEIIQEYKAAGWGVYDDTPDMNRAVAWADACYGDVSSIELLFEFLGKPVLIQNLDNAGKESVFSESAESVKKAMQEFVATEHFNSYVMYEAQDRSEKERLSLEGFIEHFDVVMEYGSEQAEKFRKLYSNADGTAGEKIHEYTVAFIRRMRNE